MLLKWLGDCGANQNYHARRQYDIGDDLVLRPWER